MRSSEIRYKFGDDKPILVEEFLTGNDISVGIIGNPLEGYTVLPVSEEDYSGYPRLFTVYSAVMKQNGGRIPPIGRSSQCPLICPKMWRNP